MNEEFLLNVIGQVYLVNTEYKNCCVKISDKSLLNNILLLLDEVKNKYGFLGSTEFFESDFELYEEVNFIINLEFYRNKIQMELPYKNIMLKYIPNSIIDENRKWIKNGDLHRYLILSTEEKGSKLTLGDILYATALITTNKIDEPLIKFNENSYKIEHLCLNDSKLVIYYK